MINVFYMGMTQDDPTSFWRCTGVLNHIQDKNLSFKNIQGLTEYNWSVMAGADILFLQRPFAEAHINLMKLAKDMNIRIITDYDDDLLNIPSHNNTSITYEEQKKNTKMCIHLSDEVWVTTPALKESYKPFNRNIHIIPSGHNDYMFDVDKKMPFLKGNKIAVFRGGPSHDMDLLQDTNDIVETINENPDWKFVFMGVEYPQIFNRCGKKAGLKENVYYVPPQTIIQFYRYLHETNSNITFFPLLNNKFNQSKSNISILESTYAGSCFMGNKDCEAFNLPFVTDISMGMKESFRELTDDFFNRMKRYNEMSWDWIMQERLLSEINKIRVNRLLENG